jgi:hypothetical protein
LLATAIFGRSLLSRLCLALGFEFLASFFDFHPKSFGVFFREVRLESEGGVWHSQHAFALRNQDRDVCRHTRSQLELTVGDINYRAVGDNVLKRLGVEPKLANLPGELLAGICIDGEVRLNALAYLTYVSFVY